MSEPADLQPRPTAYDGPETGVLLDNRYLLRHVVGDGGYSTVYAAHDRKIMGPVAVKHLKNWCGEREHRRFNVEVVISGRMVHPHVIRMTDAGEYKGQPYAVMPLLAGRQLRAHRGEHWRNVALYMRQYLEGMRALHEARAFVDPDHRTRVLHRDIKPANCMVSPEGHLTIIDLGVIKPMDLPLRATTAGTLVGSTAYMAPEVLFLIERASERSDVYSLGVSFYEMLTGEIPYFGTEPDQIREQLLARREAPSVLEVRPEIPSALAALVQDAMAPLPNNRPATVAMMLDMLETILTRTGGWGLGFGPRVAIPPSIDAPAPHAPLPVVVAAPAPPPVVDAPPCDDTAPTLRPPPYDDAPAPPSRAATPAPSVAAAPAAPPPPVLLSTRRRLPGAVLLATCAAAVGAVLSPYIFRPASAPALAAATTPPTELAAAAIPVGSRPTEFAIVPAGSPTELAAAALAEASTELATADASTELAATAAPPAAASERPASLPKKSRPPATLTANEVSSVMNRAAADLRACADAPRGWVTFAVQVRERRATLQALGLGEPGACARKAVAALRFPPGAGEFRGSLRL